jgi:hypothetical protein
VSYRVLCRTESDNRGPNVATCAPLHRRRAPPSTSTSAPPPPQASAALHPYHRAVAPPRHELPLAAERRPNALPSRPKPPTRYGSSRRCSRLPVSNLYPKPRNSPRWSPPSALPSLRSSPGSRPPAGEQGPAPRQPMTQPGAPTHQNARRLLPTRVQRGAEELEAVPLRSGGGLEAMKTCSPLHACCGVR